MKAGSEKLEATLGLVRAADPLDYAEGEQPDTEAALRVILATVPASRSRRAPRRRRVLTLAGSTAGAAIATVVALNIAPSGGSEMASVLNQTGVLVSPARAAQIVARVQRQLTHFAPNEIIEFKLIGHQTGAGGLASSTWSQSLWESTSSPYRELMTLTSSSNQSASQDYSEGTTTQDILQIYDPSRNTIYEPLAKPAWRLTRGPRGGTWTVTVPRAVVYTQLARRLPAAERGTERLTVSDSQARALRSGVKQVVYDHPYPSRQNFSIFTEPRIGTYPNITGTRRPEVPASWVSGLKTRGLRVRLHGQSAIEITSKATSTTYWFSAATLYPLKSVIGFGKTAMTTRFTVYKVLSGTAASKSLLSLRHAHPTARIVVGERAFHAAETRLGA
jgi:gas vesicle protein